MSEELKTKGNGAFMDSLTRNNKEIRGDRADAIAEDAEMLYKRTIEDMERDIKSLERDRRNMLDLSPSDKLSLKLASDFDSKAFVQKDIEISVKLYNLRIKLAMAKERYDYLFTGEKSELSITSSAETNI